MLKKSGIVHITLLVHSKIAIFEWGKKIIDIFTLQAHKNKYTLSTVYDVNDVSDFLSPVVILGVDSVWINNALDKLNANKCKAILIHGTACNNYEYASHISADQRVTIQKSLNLLKKRGRTHTAFFGVQKNDTSDQIKENAFFKSFPSGDVYYIGNGIEECFERFIANLERYDSVICSDDVISIYLLSRFRALGINIPERLYLVGNGSLWLGAHVTPPLTTFSVNLDANVQLALQMCTTLCEFDSLDSINIDLSPQLISRGSTGDVSEREYREASLMLKRGAYLGIVNDSLCPELLEIVMLDRVLSTCSEDQLAVLGAWVSNTSIEKIAKELFISDNTVKYHLKALYKQLNIHSKNELMEIVNKYGIKF